MVYEPDNAVVCVELLSSTFVSAPFTDDFGLHALVSHVHQVSFHTFIKLTTATVVDAGSLLNLTLTSMEESLIKSVFLFAVLLLADDDYSFHLFPLNVAYFLSFERLATIAYWACCAFR